MIGNSCKNREKSKYLEIHTKNLPFIRKRTLNTKYRRKMCVVLKSFRWNKFCSAKSFNRCSSVPYSRIIIHQKLCVTKRTIYIMWLLYWKYPLNQHRHFVFPIPFSMSMVLGGRARAREWLSFDPTHSVDHAGGKHTKTMCESELCECILDVMPEVLFLSWTNWALIVAFMIFMIISIDGNVRQLFFFMQLHFKTMIMITTITDVNNN